MTAPRGAAAWRALRIAGASGLLAAMGLSAACGGSGSGSGATADATQAGDVVAYCALSREVNTSGATPTTLQVNELIRLAPVEIRGDVSTFLLAGEASDTGIEAFTRILDYESAHC